MNIEIFDQQELLFIMKISDNQVSPEFCFLK